MQAFYGTRISEHISESPEGFLICHSAPLARTAVRVPQQYRGNELGLPTDDTVDVYRSPREVLSKKFLASLEGKPVTDAHPPQFLNADNAMWYLRGHVQNVKPGPLLPDGEQSVVGDLVITDPALIAKIKAGIRGLSVGYVYDMHKADGRVSQTNLAANHVAVVPDGRAGQHVRIMDAAPAEDFYAVCARYHRTNPITVAASRSRRAADSADSGEPRGWDELATELGGLMGPREETMEKSEYKELIATLERIERLFANGNVALVDEAPQQDNWAEDGALADLRKLRPFIQASGNRVAIDSYNAAVRTLKRMPRHLVTDASAPSGGTREDIQQEFENNARRYHRRNFHIREDKESPRSEERTVRVAQDTEESFEDICRRRRRELFAQHGKK